MRFLSRVPLLIVFGVSPVLAQTSAAMVPLPSAYSAEPVVVVSMADVFRMQADGTGVEEKTVVARVQAESALKELAVLSLGFAANSQHVEWVYARIRHVDGTVTNTPVDSAIEVAEQVTREAPFYSDLKQSQLPLKDLRVGDQLEWQGRIVRTKPEAPNEFWDRYTFIKDGVLLAETVELNLPKDQYINVWSPQLKAVESTEGDRHIYRWSTDNKKPTVGSVAEAFKEAEKKRVRSADEELDDREGKLPDMAWTTFKSWEAVGAWYRGLEGDRMVPDAEIKAEVAKLTEGKTTEEAKVQAVYTYVATQIHYIGVAFGVGRYQPHSAADVIGNQYGDCKDKHTLLAAMLEALGLHPDAVLIGAGIRFNPAIPSPESFNHLITRVNVAGKVTWLDTTAEVAPYGMLIFATRDKQALVVPATGPALVERTPARPPFPSTLTMDSVGKLDSDGQSISRITWTFRGDDEVTLRAVFRQISPAQYDQLVQRLCGSMGYAGTASHQEVSRLEDTETPFKVSFDYKRDKGGDWPNLKAIPQLYPVILPRGDDKEPPVEAMPLGVPRVESSTAAMTLPEGWTAELPQALHLNSTWVNYDLTYKFEKGVVYAQRRLEVLQDRVPVSEWKSYDKVAAKVSDEQFVQLVRATGKGNKTATIVKPIPMVTEILGGKTDAPPDDRSPETLVQDAYAALQRDDLASAEPLLNRVKAMKPEQQGLWVAAAVLALKHGDITVAIDDYEKELKLHPSEVQIYKMLAGMEVSVSKRPAAEETLRRWADASPEDPQPLMTLASMQLEDDKPADAVSSAARAKDRAKEDTPERVDLLLGQAQLKSGQKEQGHATLLALVKKTDDPDLMNDAAYELADAGLELPLAEKVTRTALDKMEEESRTWTLDESPQLLSSKTAMIQATWDTMGWILYREGHAAAAEGYIKASWAGGQSAEVGKHLAEMAEAKGDKNAALTYYELAIATVPSFDSLGVHKPPTPLQRSMTEKVEKLRKAGARSTVGDGATALQKLRTLTIGPGGNGYADYKLLVNKDGIVKAEPMGDKTVPDAMALIKRAKVGVFFPPGSQGQLVLARVLNCHQGTCELVAMR